MKKILLFIIVLVSIPIMVINFFYSLKKGTFGFIENEIVINENSNKQNIQTIRVLDSNNNIRVINLEDYLVGVIAGEVPLSFEEEALKAQAVASRTYALKQIENNKELNYDVTDNTSSQVFLSDEVLKNKWGNNYEEYIDKIKKVVNDTSGEYITYNGEIIYAFFFSTSNGFTEDNKNVFGKDLPYLKVVDSSFDKNETNSFEVKKEYSKTDFCNLLDITCDSINISDISRSESNRVLSLKINEKCFKGRDFQKILNLRSNDFNINIDNDNVTIITKGFGHGVGMSQYGANALAKNNKTYKEILKYYYLGTEIKKL